MLSKIPFSMENLESEDINRQILRIGLIAELDAINLYEQLASLTNDEKIKAIFLDIAREEKTHVGEFLTLLLMNDEEQEDELEEGREEVEELFEEEEEK
ncbi:MAG: ferritin family protein [Thermodesulfovibrio sp.]|jgi:rubrerythrin|uniref:ferritin family protein n=1 Tax=unclassified Thermodesulfovibrio TaxID=2645936 RepID=UPI00083B1AA9|nr:MULTISPECIES: ferritin family protein [unclassified Thermodesulfovibrio]MDI1471952.1 ferritin family protein [Thermodesulfovibrio sp. 1176]MDI6714977.1 ferritin family protein [Thermodesulfovibrio sp.]ODA44255.1 Ferritin-like di-iron-carboxylate protein [Thermodesulfovibrio sp. N1]